MNPGLSAAVRAGCLLAMACLTTLSNGTQVYRCEDPPGFQDRPCPDGRLIEVHEPQLVPFEPVASVETRSRQPQRRTRAGPRKGKRPRQDCDSTRSALKKLRAKRRRGYRAEEEDKLDAERRRLRAQLRERC